MVSLVAEHGLQELWHVGSSQTRDRTCAPCTGRKILHHWATREAQEVFSMWQLCFNISFVLPWAALFCLLNSGSDYIDLIGMSFMPTDGVIESINIVTDSSVKKQHTFCEISRMDWWIFLISQIKKSCEHIKIIFYFKIRKKKSILILWRFQRL